MEVTVETEIAAPPDIVFATMTDVARWPDFIGGVERVEVLTEGPVRVSTRFRETRQMFGRPATEEMTVADLEPPRRFVLTAENHGTRYVATHEVTPSASGARLALTFAGTPVTFAARLFSVIGLLFMGSLRRQLETDLREVKAEAERRARGAAASQGQPRA
jgi:uncharacterized protein YndB with AHSA1/START domain